MRFLPFLPLVLWFAAGTLLLASPPTVTVVVPEKSDTGESIKLPARTLAAESASIYSRATGVLSERRKDIGDRVKQGDILAVIAAPEIDREVERARAVVAQAEARAELARMDRDRASKMAGSRVIAAGEYDQRRAEAKTAEADLQAAKAELNRLLEIQAFQFIRAPFDGIISGRQVDRGDHVRGDQFQTGDWLFQIVRLDELLVDLDAAPAAALRIEPGMKANVEFSELPGRKFSASVERKAGVIDAASGTMQIQMVMPNPDLLLPAGLTGTAAVELADAPKALRIPYNALITREGRNMVAVIRDGRVAFVPVDLGRNLGASLEILAGLTDQDKVVVSPNSLLAEGDEVALNFELE